MAEGMDALEEVLTVKQAAARVKVSEDFFYRLLAKRKGPRVKRVGNRIRITVTAFNQWINPKGK
jgi:excisionase family DNA binding protein